MIKTTIKFKGKKQELGLKYYLIRIKSQHLKKEGEQNTINSPLTIQK